MRLNGNGLHEFECFRLDAVKRVLERDGEPVSLTPKAFDVLEHLVERAGEDVTKHDLMDAVWPDTAVEENNLNQAISAVRRALGERPNDHRFIVTLPGRGYRFVAKVTSEAPAGEHADLIAQWTASRIRIGLAAAACLLLLATLGVLAVRILRTPASGDPGIATALDTPASEPAIAGRRHDSASPEAYEAYLRGRYFWNMRSSDGFARSIAAYQQAIAADPAYALAYAGLADSYVLVGLGEVDAVKRSAALDRARDAAHRAVALDDSLAETHTSLAAILEVYEKDRAGAEREYKRAIELNPNYATAHQWYGEFLEADGRFDEAEVVLEHARRIDPLSLVVTVALGENLFFQRRYDEAIENFRRALELDSEFARARYDLGLALEQKKQYDLAVAEFRRVQSADGFNSRAVAALAHVYANSGRLDVSRRIVTDFDRRADDGHVEPYDMAIVYAGLGDTEQAITWARRARARLDGNLLWLTADPRFDELRADDRYRQMLGG